MEQERIEQAATKLGADVQIDVEAVAERVVAELRAQPTAARAWWRRSAVLQVAAVLTALVTGGVLMSRVVSHDPAAGHIALL